MFESALGALGMAGLQFGSNAASAAMNAKITRSLRRSVYQDQVHSLRQAGLNPILAVGQTPGMGPMGSMQSPDLSSALESSLKGAKNADERALLKSQSSAAEAAARKAKAEADIAEHNRDNIVNKTGAEADLIGANAQAQKFRNPFISLGASADMQSKLTRSRLLTQELEANLPAIMREQRQAEAGLASARESGVRFDNIPKRIEADYQRDYEALIRAGRTAEEAYDILGPMVSVFMKGRAARQGDTRERNTNARDAQRQEREHRDTVTREREQDRRDRAEERRDRNGSRN